MHPATGSRSCLVGLGAHRCRRPSVRRASSPFPPPAPRLSKRGLISTRDGIEIGPAILMKQRSIRRSGRWQPRRCVLRSMCLRRRLAHSWRHTGRQSGLATSSQACRPTSSTTTRSICLDIDLGADRARAGLASSLRLFIDACQRGHWSTVPSRATTGSRVGTDHVAPVLDCGGYGHRPVMWFDTMMARERYARCGRDASWTL